MFICLFIYIYTCIDQLDLNPRLDSTCSMVLFELKFLKSVDSWHAPTWTDPRCCFGFGFLSWPTCSHIVIVFTKLKHTKIEELFYSHIMKLTKRSNGAELLKKKSHHVHRKWRFSTLLGATLRRLT